MMERYELVIVGGGPAGMNGAIEAAKAGVKKIAIVDENFSVGGQLVKQTHKFFGGQEHRAGTRGIDIATAMARQCRELNIHLLTETAVWAIFDTHTLALYHQGKQWRIRADRILLATGAAEKTVAFPGWTLPGVMGAGAIQTMINVHRVLPGSRILMVGSGNVGLIVSYQLMQSGAEVVGVIDVLPKITGYGVHAAKIARMGVPILTSHGIGEVSGDDMVQRAVIHRVDENFQPLPGSRQEIDVDTVCIAVGLSPLAELAWMCGCECLNVPVLGGWVPCRNQKMETSVPGVYVAGDASGIEEASTALMTGAIAGIAVAESLGYLNADACEALCDEKNECLNPFRTNRFEFKQKALSQVCSQKGVVQC